MSLRVVQSVVGNFNGAATASATLTGVTAGSAILVASLGSGFGTAPLTYSVTDGGVAIADLYQPSNFGPLGGGPPGAYLMMDWALKYGVASGSHAIVSTNSAGGSGNSGGYVIAIEIAGLVASAALDVNSVGTSFSGPPDTGATATPAGTNEIAFAACTILTNTGATLSSPPASGFTNVQNNQSANTFDGCFSLDVLTPVALSAQEAIYSGVTGTSVMASIIVLKGATVSVATTGQRTRRGRGY